MFEISRWFCARILTGVSVPVFESLLTCNWSPGLLLVQRGWEETARESGAREAVPILCPMGQMPQQAALSGVPASSARGSVGWALRPLSSCRAPTAQSSSHALSPS